MSLTYQHMAMLQAFFVNYFFESDFCLNKEKGSKNHGDECKI